MAISFRMSAGDYAALRREIEEGPFDSLQQLIEARVFGEVRPRRKRGPKPKPRQTERLDLTA